MYFNYLDKVDPEVASMIRAEMDRQENKIELIASENFTDGAVMEANGSALTNKYAEGLPGHRYYGGCECVDQVEQLAIDRVKKLFGADHANVQPHAGSSTNLISYMALLSPGDTVLGMDLSNGGHLTHGSKVNTSGKLYQFHSYGLNPDTERIDFDEIRKLAKELKPKMIVAGASAYPRIIDSAKFKEIADEVGAYFLFDMAHIAGLVAAGLHPNPVEYADVVTTTTHKTLRGPRGGVILCKEEFAKKIDKSVFPGNQGGPLEHVIAAKAVCFKEASTPEFAEYQKQVVANAKFFAEALLARGFKLVTGGTDNHLILVNVLPKGLTGRDAEIMLDACGITTNKNTIPNDPNGANVSSGIRLGTPAMTTRGFKEAEFEQVADAITMVLDHPGDEAYAKKAAAIVKELCTAYPLYKNL
ncbi:MAG: serine hydroxymethyltransferase [Firmicutes bacterium]|nr:serine hydroxymethyltransferase [Bacillota bacterium]